MNSKRFALLISLALLWLLLGSPGVIVTEGEARADDGSAALTGTLTVCPGGPPTCDYSIIQEAVDAAAPGDTVEVATGVYAGTHDKPAPPGYPFPPADNLLSQVVYISKTLTIRGGYTTNGFADPPDPKANPTILDAQGSGRVLFVTGEISPTIEGLSIIDGDATGLGGQPNRSYHDAGGGVYVIDATAFISHCQMLDSSSFFGGGLFSFRSYLTFEDNTVSGNIGVKEGGGLFLWDSVATLNGNAISANDAGDGGGLGLYYSDTFLSANVLAGNHAYQWHGGGLFASASEVTLNENIIVSNTATGDGGGLYSTSSTITLISNTVSANTAEGGAGLTLSGLSNGTLNGNTISVNIGEYSGGVLLFNSNASVSKNAIISNTGGGLSIEKSSNAILTNNLIASNVKSYEGDGLLVKGSSAHLVHNTIVRNGSSPSALLSCAVRGTVARANALTVATSTSGNGIYVAKGGDGGTHPSNVWLTNTILISHNTGIYVTEGNTATLKGTLWGNEIDWGGEGTIVTGTHNYWGDPAFEDPIGGDYHLRDISAARDVGIVPDAAVNWDVDGQPRLMDQGYDLGFDEYPGAGLALTRRPTLVALNRGQTFTYTLAVTSAGGQGVTGLTLTDTLDAWQRPITATSSLGHIVLDPNWGGSVVCTPGDLVAGTAIYVTVTAQVSPGVPLRQPMTGGLVAKANETSNSLGDTTYGQDCHSRVNDDPAEYSSIQAAVDAAKPGDLVEVAGTCLGVPAGSWQEKAQVYLDKSLSVRGGYSLDFEDWNPSRYPSTLDALGMGRVLHVSGPSTSSTIEGLDVTGGRTTWLGGGIHVFKAQTILSNCQVFSNTAFWGGGLSLVAGEAVLQDNAFTNNSSGYWYYEGSEGGMGEGGGLYLKESDAALISNVVSANTTIDGGGGMCSWRSAITLTNNAISGNTAGGGGGLQLSRYSDATLDGNVIAGNVVRLGGGGLYMNTDSQAILINTLIVDNQAYRDGSGLYIHSASLQAWHNTIARNSGANGIYVTDYPNYSAVLFTNTILVSHTVGVYVEAGNAAVLESTLWGNETDWAGPGTIITGTHNAWGDSAFVNPEAGDYHISFGSAAIDAGLNTRVTTDIDGEPRIDGYPDLGADEVGALLLVSKQAKPDPVWPGACLTYTLHLTNAGVVSLTAALTDVLPAHVVPSGLLTRTLPPLVPGDAWAETVVVTVAGDYGGRLTNVLWATSDQGATGAYTETTQVQTVPALSLTKVAYPDPVQAGERLTYTLRVTNAGNVTLTATFTDVLPGPVTPGGLLTWTAILPAPGGVWSRTVVVTVPWGSSGTLTNVLRATTREGASSVYTETSGVVLTPPITPVLISPPNGLITTAQTITLSWAAGAGNPPTRYNLDLDGAVVTSTSTSSATLLPIGIHTWTVRAFNQAGYSDWATPWTVEITETPPCTQVTGVALSRATPGTVYAGDTVDFQADVAPDDLTTPYSYTIHLDGMTLVYPQAGDTGSFTLSHTFPATGTYIMEVAVWNCDLGQTGAVTDALAVEVVEQVEYWVYLAVVIKND